MAKTDFSLTAFKITSTSTTGAFHDLGPFITDYSGLDIEALTEESHGMGDNWVKNAFVGVRQVNSFTIGGLYDDVATSGPVALLGNATDVGAERCIKLNFGTTNAYPKMDVLVKRFSRRPGRSALTKWEAEFLPASSYVIVTT